MSARALSPAFTSTVRSERVAAILGVALGVAFTTCFATGLYSHLLQNPPSWFAPPARPAGLYRITQGLHVATGIASIPLLFAKLWSVFPKLFQWPPFTGFAHALERLALVPLVGGAVFELMTGLANVNLWYPWPFGFRAAHYWVAWLTIGALVVHAGAKWSATRGALVRRPAGTEVNAEHATDRRTFLAVVFGASGLLTIFSVGQTVGPLRGLALLAPRRPDVGPQGFPVNKTAHAAGVEATARDPGFRLTVEGRVTRTLRLSVTDLAGLEQHQAILPIACVQGWSASKRWTGVPVRDLLAAAGAADDAQVTVHSLQERGPYRASEIDLPQTRDPDTLLALRVGGEPLDVDHGYPVRLVGPGRPGVLQTKWVTRLVVH
jgi:hypothetical protein